MSQMTYMLCVTWYTENNMDYGIGPMYSYIIYSGLKMLSIWVLWAQVSDTWAIVNIMDNGSILQ